MKTSIKLIRYISLIILVARIGSTAVFASEDSDLFYYDRSGTTLKVADIKRESDPTKLLEYASLIKSKSNPALGSESDRDRAYEYILLIAKKLKNDSSHSKTLQSQLERDRGIFTKEEASQLVWFIRWAQLDQHYKAESCYKTKNPGITSSALQAFGLRQAEDTLKIVTSTTARGLGDYSDRMSDSMNLEKSCANVFDQGRNHAKLLNAAIRASLKDEPSAISSER